MTVRRIKFSKRAPMFGITKEFAFSQAKMFLSIFGLYISWILLHYIASHLYIRLCVQATLMGFILSPFLAPAPHCQALRWAIYNGGNSIVAMWVLVGMWIMKFLTPVTQH